MSAAGSDNDRSAWAPSPQTASAWPAILISSMPIDNRSRIPRSEKIHHCSRMFSLANRRLRHFLCSLRNILPYKKGVKGGQSCPVCRAVSASDNPRCNWPHPCQNGFENISALRRAIGFCLASTGHRIGQPSLLIEMRSLVSRHGSIVSGSKVQVVHGSNFERTRAPETFPQSTQYCLARTFGHQRRAVTVPQHREIL